VNTLKKKEERKITTYYSIDFTNNKVIFLTAEQNLTSWESIPADAYTTISFDEILNDIIEFRALFLNFENLKDRLISLLPGDGAVFHNTLKELYSIYINSSNYFTRYYNDYIYNFYVKERDSIKAIILDKTLKSAIDNINNEYNRIRKATNYKYYFSLNSNCSIQVISCEEKKYVIRSHDRNEIYYEANILLSNLFYDLSSIIQNKKLNICRCKYCKSFFFGSKNNVCCNDVSCRDKHLHIIKNEQRREKSKDPYVKHITLLNDYLSQQTYQLKAIVQENMNFVDKFKSRNSEFRQKMKDEIERCRIENIIPGPDQDIFLKKLQAEIFVYRTRIADEWKSKNNI